MTSFTYNLCPELHDLTIKCKNGEFMDNKYMMCHLFPTIYKNKLVFFENKFDENILYLGTFSVEAVKFIVKYMYDGILGEASADVVREAISFADYIGVKSLPFKSLLEGYVRKGINVDNAGEFLRVTGKVEYFTRQAMRHHDLSSSCCDKFDELDIKSADLYCTIVYHGLDQNGFDITIPLDNWYLLFVYEFKHYISGSILARFIKHGIMAGELRTKLENALENSIEKFNIGEIYTMYVELQKTNAYFPVYGRDVLNKYCVENGLELLK